MIWVLIGMLHARPHNALPLGMERNKIKLAFWETKKEKDLSVLGQY